MKNSGFPSAGNEKSFFRGKDTNNHLHLAEMLTNELSATTL
jgi:hypothetical protein